jgi:hypothetical protein
MRSQASRSDQKGPDPTGSGCTTGLSISAQCSYVGHTRHSLDIGTGTRNYLDTGTVYLILIESLSNLCTVMYLNHNVFVSIV